MLPKTSLQQSVMVMRNIKDLKLLQQGKLTQAPERGSINNLKWESRFWPFLRFWPGEQWSTCSWTLSSSHSYWSRLPEIFSSLAHRADVSNALTWSDILMVMSSFVLNILHFILKEYKTHNKTILKGIWDDSHWQLWNALLLWELASGPHGVLEDLKEDVVQVGGNIGGWNLALQKITDFSCWQSPTFVLGLRSLVSSALAFSRGWSKYSAATNKGFQQFGKLGACPPNEVI